MSSPNTYELRKRRGLEWEEQAFQKLTERIARPGLCILHMPSDSPYPDIVIIYHRLGRIAIIGVECKNWAGYSRTSGHVWKLMAPKFNVGQVRYYERIVLMSADGPVTQKATEALNSTRLKLMILPTLIEHLNSLIEKWSFYVMPRIINNQVNTPQSKEEPLSYLISQPKMMQRDLSDQEISLKASTSVCGNPVLMSVRLNQRDDSLPSNNHIRCFWDSLVLRKEFFLPCGLGVPNLEEAWGPKLPLTG